MISDRSLRLGQILDGGGDWRENAHPGKLLLAKLDAMAAQPTASALDQSRERLAESFDPIADFLGFDIRGGVLQPSLEDVELVQQRRLGLGQSFIGGERLKTCSACGRR